MKKIDVKRDFQTSVNIAYDLNKIEKIKSFIPTYSSIDLIEEYLKDISSNFDNRAKILVGSYGKGKSHIILVIINILKGINESYIYKLIEYIRAYKPELAELIHDYLRLNKKLLPVIIEGGRTSLEQSFLLGLKKALEDYGFENLMPENYYNMVIRTIEDWENNYPETYSKLKNKIDNMDEFKNEIKNYNMSAYKKFEDIYPELTAGGRFNPYVGANAVDMYEDVTSELVKRGYIGINVVYDEFSKYLESSIEDAGINDIRLLQDFAEKCNRSSEGQMHLTLISHKELNNYIDLNLSKNKIDGWKGISGRFKHINYSSNNDEFYEIISKVIEKNNNFWNEFKESNLNKFNEMKRTLVDSKYFFNGYTEKEIEENMIYGCYPLHPYTTYILPRLSEKIAQNERTTFTFISSSQKNTLFNYLRNIDLDKFNLMTPDYLYDYFSDIFRMELYGRVEFDYYIFSKRALSSLEVDSLEAKIIKTVTIINILDDNNKLQAKYETIVDIYKLLYDKEIVEDVLNSLIKNKYLYKRISDNRLILRDNLGIDLEKEINKYVELHSKFKNIDEIINSTILEPYIYSNRYNEEYEIIRYFKYEFITINRLENIELTDERQDFGLGANGIIYMILTNNLDERKKAQQFIKNNEKLEKYIFVLPKNNFIKEEIIYRYDALQNLKSEAVEKDDDQLADEYNIYMDDISEEINNHIERFTRPELSNSEIYYKGSKKTIKRSAMISSLISEIFENIYYKTPVINNEFVNKNYLSTAAFNSRSRVIKGLLNKFLEPNLGLIGHGQDVSIMRNTLVRTGIIKDVESSPYIDLKVEDSELKEVLRIIQEFLISEDTNELKSFKALYSELIDSKHGIGLKKGLIPIYLSVVLSKYIDNVIIINNDIEMKMTSELINNIDKKPEEYYIKIDDLNKEKLNYINSLEDMFSDFINPSERSFNNLSHIVYAINRWYMSLPKYTKDAEQIYLYGYGLKDIKNEELELKKIARVFEQNPRELLYKKIPKIFDQKLGDELANNIMKSKAYIDSIFNELIEELKKEIKDIFDAKDNESLISAMKNWKENLKSDTVNYIFGNEEALIFEIIDKVENDDFLLIKELGKCLISLRLEDWNNNIVLNFIDEITEYKKKVDKFDEETDLEIKPTSVFRLTAVDENGEELTRVFEKVEYSNLAKLLSNDILNSIDEMGESISPQEKRQVLLEILERI